ncbi:hypothetical protein FAUST_7597 [Fusarium austroamericanum]|uniref:Myb-like domain-containing protein n=1 Tax=Fusarium austroamericanum TaxID=282268 RepID=A0AAN5Z6B4_FUSAU|nr:hypothetical protein FAUST_7597 [Fusarium austroamericanum]
MANTNTKNPHVSRLRPWQRRALDNGRTPLPEAQGDQRWLSSPCHSQQHAGSFTQGATSTTPAGESSGKVSTNVATPSFSYRFWPEDEMRHLIALRNGGATWAMIYTEFPNRTHEAIKQAYHKRRHAIEQLMENEATGATSS